MDIETTACARGNDRMSDVDGNVERARPSVLSGSLVERPVR